MKDESDPVWFGSKRISYQCSFSLSVDSVKFSQWFQHKITITRWIHSAEIHLIIFFPHLSETRWLFHNAKHQIATSPALYQKSEQYQSSKITSITDRKIEKHIDETISVDFSYLIRIHIHIIVFLSYSIQIWRRKKEKKKGKEKLPSRHRHGRERPHRRRRKRWRRRSHKRHKAFS